MLKTLIENHIPRSFLAIYELDRTNGSGERRKWHKNYTIGTPLVQLNPFIECLDIMHTYSRALRATFGQVMQGLRKKLDQPTSYVYIY